MLIEIFHTSPAHVEVLSQPVKQITPEQSFSNFCQCCQVTRQQNMIRLRYYRYRGKQCKLSHVSASHEFPCPAHVPRLLIYPHKYGDNEGHRFGHN